jgi:hypothetical protein
MKAGFLLLTAFVLFILPAFAQPGISELSQATADLKHSFFSARDATLVLATLFGIVGAVKVYYNWQMGKDRHITAEVAAWFFASFFMILLGPFLQALFGI